MTSQTILITGATDGLGRALVDRLADQGHHLILHGRRPSALSNAAGDIQRRTGERPATVVADLADLRAVRRVAEQVRAQTPQLDALVNNAGIGAGEPEGTTRGVTVDGLESRFAVNYLAAALLSLDLLPLLRASRPARIVNVASIGQNPIDFDDLMLEHHYDGVRAYGQSKLALITFGFELAARLPADEVTVNSLHPATFMPTKMVLESVGYSIDDLDTGVVATHRLITDPTLANVSGRFYDRQRETRANPQAYDSAIRQRLWTATLALLYGTDTAIPPHLG